MAWCERRGLSRDAESVVMSTLDYLEQERVAAIVSKRERESLGVGKD